MAESEDRVENNIRRLRFERNEMTQEQLARMAGVNRHTIMAIEAGKYAPSLLLAFRIAAALNCPMEAVFTYRSGRAEPTSQ